MTNFALISTYPKEVTYFEMTQNGIKRRKDLEIAKNHDTFALYPKEVTKIVGTGRQDDFVSFD